MASLVTVPLTYAYLGPERYGLWMVLLSFIAAVSFADLGIGLGLINAISEAYGNDNHEGAREYLTSAFVMLSMIAIVLGIAGSIAYPFIPWMRLFNVKGVAVAQEGARALVVLFAWFLVSIPLGVIARAQAGLQKGYIPQIIGALGNVISLLALLVVIKLHGSLPLLVFGSTFGTMASIFANGWILFHAHPWLLPTRNAYRKRSAVRILQLGMMFFVLQFAVTVAWTSDNIVITQVLGAGAVAVYAVPQRLFGFASAVTGMAVGPLWPAFGEAIARGDVAWVRRIFFGSFWLAFLISLSTNTLLVCTAPWILKVFFGKSLHTPISLLVVLGLWSVLFTVSLPITGLLNGAGVLKEQTVATVLGSLCNLGLSILLTRRFGVVGVCSGSIITQLLISLPTYVFLVRRLFRTLEAAKTNQGYRDLTLQNAPE